MSEASAISVIQPVTSVQAALGEVSIAGLCAVVGGLGPIFVLDIAAETYYKCTSAQL